ncbi:golgi SNAP receptor complex member Gos28 [Dermatophagoides pteronyssinus]|uniref:Golgi SNAP receptor complex member 1 n=2 Tax=Dermatophagoides pteronyssinus TaxID=6956 RepID=A0ABQ8JSH1_DERPT|nr:Golgi SNAP receptor complex member 1-like [Dermatophagoides pteronyssinus]KAH9425492.1 Golgi SNAP receptor complex member 1 [Dermatophagoides pteronyssinus]
MAMDNSDNNNSSIKQWEELRRLARQYETDIDTKLVSLSKLMSLRNERKYSSTGGKKFQNNHRNKQDDDDDDEPLISSKENFDHLTFEIDSLINTLQDVNNKMDQCIQQLPNNNSILYTLQRHQDILNDYRKEFYKLRTNIGEQLNRDLLLQNSMRKDYNNDYGQQNRKADFLLLKETDHIRNSEIMIDDQINIAIRTRDTLRQQRSTMKAIQTQLTTLANKFPMINNVMHRIGMKKRKDSIILAIVIGICFFLLLLWIF